MGWDADEIISEWENADDDSEASASYCRDVTDSSTSELVSSWNQALADSTDMDD